MVMKILLALIKGDRDGYTRDFDDIMKSGDIKSIKLPRQSPDLNAFAERFVLSIKSECLDKFLPVGERFLRQVITEYLDH